MTDAPQPRLIACSQCGWVHFTRTREEVERDVFDFNTYFDSLDVAGKLNYRFMRGAELEAFLALPVADQHARLETAKASTAQYLNCFRCGAPSGTMRPAEENEAPRGSTLQPIMWPA